MNNEGLSMSEQNKRLDWEENHRRISDAVLSHVASSKKPPTQEQIAKLSGLSRETVNKHLQELDYDRLFERERSRLAIHSDVLTMALLNSAMKGSGAAQKMCFQIIYGWAEPKSYTHVIEETSSKMSDEDIQHLEEATKMMEKLTIMRYEQRKQQEQRQQAKQTEQQPAP